MLMLLFLKYISAPEPACARANVYYAGVKSKSF